MIETISLYILPIMILSILTLGMTKKVPVYEEFIEGYTKDLAEDVVNLYPNVKIDKSKYFIPKKNLFMIESDLFKTSYRLFTYLCASFVL